MENTPYLYDTLLQVLRQQAKGLDLRHLKTLAWMMVGLIQSRRINLTAWAPYVVSRARYAQSTVLSPLAGQRQDRGLLSVWPPDSQAWLSGVSRCSMWPWTPRCCGIPTA